MSTAYVAPARPQMYQRQLQKGDLAATMMAKQGGDGGSGGGGAGGKQPKAGGQFSREVGGCMVVL